jgi:hypothetical protein
MPQADILSVFSGPMGIRMRTSKHFVLVCAASVALWSQAKAEPTITPENVCPVSQGPQANDSLQALGVPANGRIVFAPGAPGFVDRDGALGIKFPWKRLVRGSLTVGGRRLDGDAAPARAYMNHGYGTTGLLPTYLVFPTPGCWEVMGRIGEQSLTFVVYVEKIGNGPEWRYEGLPNDGFWYQTML